MSRLKTFDIIVKTKYLPKSYEFGTLYVCKQSKTVRFLCPDESCKKPVILPLTDGPHDSWNLTYNKARFSFFKFNKDTKVTLYPSVWSLQHENKCHFWIKDNRIDWVSL